MKNDRMLPIDIDAALRRELPLDAEHIGVEVHHGTVRLAGNVGSAVARLNAETAARQVQGVREVVMDVDVRFRADSEHQNPDLAA